MIAVTLPLALAATRWIELPWPVTATRACRTPSKGGGASAGPAAFAAALASKLGVSTSAAQRALDQIEALSRGGIDPASPAFAAVAHDLGVSPDRLDAALAAAKGSLAGGPPNGK